MRRPGDSYLLVKMGKKDPPLRQDTMTRATNKPMAIPWRKQHKFNARRTEYNGVSYPSAREAAYAQELDIRVRVGELASWERQIKFDLVVNGAKIGRFTIDFLEIDKKGNKIYTEVKGMRTDVFKLRWVLFRALYPDITARIVD